MMVRFAFVSSHHSQARNLVGTAITSMLHSIPVDVLSHVLIEYLGVNSADLVRSLLDLRSPHTTRDRAERLVVQYCPWVDDCTVRQMANMLICLPEEDVCVRLKVTMECGNPLEGRLLNAALCTNRVMKMASYLVIVLREWRAGRGTFMHVVDGSAWSWREYEEGEDLQKRYTITETFVVSRSDLGCT